jgi:hypothetical protein
LDVSVPSFETSADGFLLFIVSVRLVRSWVPESSPTSGDNEDDKEEDEEEDEEIMEEEEVRAWVLKKRFSEFKTLHAHCVEDAGFRDWFADCQAAADGIGNAARVANVVSAAVSAVTNESAKRDAQQARVAAKAKATGKGVIGGGAGAGEAGESEGAGGAGGAGGAAALANEEQRQAAKVDLGAAGIVVENALSHALTDAAKRQVEGLTFPTATLGVVKLLPLSMTGAWVNGHYEIRRKALDSFLRLVVGGSGSSGSSGASFTKAAAYAMSGGGSRASELTAAAAYAAASAAIQRTSRYNRRQALEKEQETARVEAQQARFKSSEGYEANRRLLHEFYTRIDPTKVCV